MGETADIALAVETCQIGFGRESCNIFFGAPLEKGISYAFVLERPNGTRVAFSFSDTGWLMPHETEQASEDVVLLAGDAGKWRVVVDNSDNLSTASTTDAATSNPRGESPDGTLYELSVANGGLYFNVTAV